MTLQLPVPLFVDIAPGGNPASNGDDWVWREVTEDVRHRRGVTIFQGRGDEATLVDAGTIDLDLNNGPSKVAATLGQIGCYSPRNPTGPYYGSLNQNMPLRVGTYAGIDTFSRTEATGLGVSDSGHTWSIGGAASTWSVTGGVGTKSIAAANTQSSAVLTSGGGVDVDITMVVALPATATGADLHIGITARLTDSSNRFIFRADFASGAGSITATIRKELTGTGSTVASAAVASSAYTAGQRWKIRGQADGQNLRMKIWKEADSEPDAWTVTGTDTDHQSAAGVGIYFLRPTGNTNSVQPQFHFDDYTVKAVEALGNVTELPVRWDRSGNDSWAPVTASGVLRRLQQAPENPLNSPLYNQLIAQTASGYWPMEGGSDSTDIGAATARTRPGKVIGPVTFAGDDTLPGSITSLKLNDGTSRAQFRVGRLLGTTGFSAMVFFKVDGTAPVTDTEILKLTTLGPVYTWRIRINGGSLIVNGYDLADNLIIDETGVTGLDFSAGWTAIQLETEVTGGATDWVMLYNFVGSPTFFAFGDTYATTTAMRVVTAQLTGNGTSPMAYAHMWLGPNTLPFVDDAFLAVANGYAGETDTERIARVAADGGIPVLIEPGDGKPLGKQPRGGALQVIRDAEAAGQGVLYERGPGLAYRPLAARYDPPATLALDIGSGQLADPPEPTDDDRYMVNDVTVTRPDAGSAREVDEDHVAAHGTYPSSVTLGVQTDDALPDYAGWLLRLGTYDDLRWPRLGLNFRRNPDLLAAWRARRHGFRVTVAGEPDQILGSPPDVIVEGVTQIIRVDEWTAELSTSPARPYVIPAVDDTEWIFDFEGTTTAEALDTTETGVDITTPAGEPPATSDLIGALIVIGGETMTVTNVTGAGASQTLSVTRSVNGVVKGHDTGALVRLKYPTYIAL